MRFSKLVFVAPYLLIAPISHATDVSAKVQNHSLKISANDVCAFDIDQIGLTSGSFRITPHSPGGVTTTINGSTTPIVLTGVSKDVRIELDEASTVNVASATVPHDLRIKTEKGGSFVVDQLAIGNDLRFDGHQAGGTLQIKSSSIGDDFELDVDAGSTILTFHDSNVDDDTKIQLGKPAFGFANVVVVDGGEFGDKFGVVGAAGDDSFSATQAPVVFDGAVDLKLGDGSNSVNVIAATFLSKSKFRGGKGTDFFQIQNASFDGAARFELGDGSNTGFVDGDTFGDDLTILGGADVDSISVSHADVGDDLSLSLGAGLDQISLDTIDVTDDFVLETGFGPDNVSQNAVVVGGTSTVN